MATPVVGRGEGEAEGRGEGEEEGGGEAGTGAAGILIGSTSSTVRISSLPEDADRGQIYSACITFGCISGIRVPQKRRGVCFVTFEEAEDAAACVDNMDGAELGGSVLEVDLAKQRR